MVREGEVRELPVIYEWFGHCLLATAFLRSAILPLSAGAPLPDAPFEDISCSAHSHGVRRRVEAEGSKRCSGKARTEVRNGGGGT